MKEKYITIPHQYITIGDLGHLTSMNFWKKLVPFSHFFSRLQQEHCFSKLVEDQEKNGVVNFHEDKIEDVCFWKKEQHLEFYGIGEP